MTETSEQTTRDPVEVHVTGSDKTEAAKLLLQAARDTGYPIESVATIDGGFLVPYAVAVEAGALPGEDDDPGTVAKIEPTDTQTAAHPEVTGQAEEEAEVEVTNQDGTTETVTGTLPASAAVDDGTGSTSPAPAGEEEILRGEALDAALKERSLSTAGTADEKRARVAEYDAAQASSSTQQ